LNLFQVRSIHHSSYIPYLTCVGVGDSYFPGIIFIHPATTMIGNTLSHESGILVYLLVW